MWDETDAEIKRYHKKYQKISYYSWLKVKKKQKKEWNMPNNYLDSIAPSILDLAVPTNIWGSEIHKRWGTKTKIDDRWQLQYLKKKQKQNPNPLKPVKEKPATFRWPFLHNCQDNLILDN